MTSRTGSARRGFGGFWKKLSWVLPREKTVGFRLLAEAKPGQWPCGGCHTCCGGVADGKVIIERLCISLPYVETFNSKVIKGFVPEISRYVFFVFRNPYVLCIYVMNIICTFYVAISWLCNNNTLYESLGEVRVMMSADYINQFSLIMVLDSSDELQFKTEGFRLYNTEYNARNVFKINLAQIFIATFITQSHKLGFSLGNMVLIEPGYLTSKLFNNTGTYPVFNKVQVRLVSPFQRNVSRKILSFQWKFQGKAVHG